MREILVARGVVAHFRVTLDGLNRDSVARPGSTGKSRVAYKGNAHGSATETECKQLGERTGECTREHMVCRCRIPSFTYARFNVISFSLLPNNKLASLFR